MATIHWHGRSFEDASEFERAYTEHHLAQFIQISSPFGPLLVGRELPQDKMALVQRCVDASASCVDDLGPFVAAVTEAFEKGGWKVFDPVAELLFRGPGHHAGLTTLLETLASHRSAKVRERLCALIFLDVKAETELISRENKLDLLQRLLRDRSALVRELAVDRLLMVGNCYQSKDNEILVLLARHREQEANPRVREATEFAIDVLKRPMVCDGGEWGRRARGGVFVVTDKVIEKGNQ